MIMYDLDSFTRILPRKWQGLGNAAMVRFTSFTDRDHYEQRWLEPYQLVISVAFNLFVIPNLFFSLLHHPLSGLNYCMQPLLIYWTFPSSRDDFLFTLHKIVTTRDDEETDI